MKKLINQPAVKISIIAALMVFAARPVYAMHIAEGYLPLNWCLIWGAVYLPFLIWGIFSVNKKIKGDARKKMLFAMVGAFCFVLSALKMPSVTGSSSHPTGAGLGTILFGPAAMSVIGFIVLLFQAILLAHGGLTTLGANAFSMTVAGPFIGYGIYILANKLKAPSWLSVFLAAALADLSTYAVTSFQLALVYNNSAVDFAASLTKFMTVFAVTQIPLSIVEGILTVLVFNAIKSLSTKEVNELLPVK